ncbi:MAG: hypothetical protein IKT46_05765 [Clostridia bacterium]|nr:hypothetical protein [Clostridia bacterium]
MKKAMPVLTWMFFGLTVLYPVGVIVSAFVGCSFELFCVWGYTAIIALLWVTGMILDFACKNKTNTKAMQTVLPLTTLLSLVNAVFCMFISPKILVLVFVFISFVCSCCFTVKYGRPLALKLVALILAAVMTAPIGALSFFVLIFGNIGQDTVVRTLDSPNGKYYAQVIDSDQGALGGDTIVNVYQKSNVNLILFKIQKNPQQVYLGDWGEYEYMKIYWTDNNRLMINSVEYFIDQ